MTEASVLTATNPATGEIVREHPVDPWAIVDQKLDRAERASRQWRETSFEERGKLLRAVAAQLRKDRDRYAALMTEEMGKPSKESYGEVEKAAWCAEHYADNTEGYLSSDVIESDAAKSYVQYLPLGTVLGILPWNAPFWLAFRFCAPAIMAGNTCIMKHDPHVPGCAKAIVDAFEAVDAPKGLFDTLYIQTPDVEAVIRDSRIQAVSFTGSTKGGSAVASIAASEIKPAVLELGGSDPCIVLKDADLDKAADTITLSRIINAGQSCIAAKRIIVEKDVYPQMVEKLKERLAALKMGDPKNEDTQVGPLARADLRDNLHRQVQATVEQGAQCLLGGEIPKGEGFFYPPTLLTDVTQSMCAFQEETFGPVMVVIPTDDVDQAVKLANDTPYGLAGSVWTGDTAQGEALANRIITGQISVNGIVKTDPRLPSGGVKRSGYGRELGPHGIKEFVNAQQVWIGE